jgi:hypothetical protein
MQTATTQSKDGPGNPKNPMSADRAFKVGNAPSTAPLIVFPRKIGRRCDDKVVVTGEPVVTEMP